MARAVIKEIEGVGAVLFERSKRSRNLNIFVRPFKGVRVAIPWGISFVEAENIARAHRTWINKNQLKMKQVECEYLSLEKCPEEFDLNNAKRVILSRVEELARYHGFSYNRARVRQQKTRWGSCSHINNISLNARLILLPEELVDYVILHELMHTRLKNHGKDFWGSLDLIVGKAKTLDARLRDFHLTLL